MEFLGQKRVSLRNEVPEASFNEMNRAFFDAFSRLLKAGNRLIKVVVAKGEGAPMHGQEVLCA